MKFYVAGNKSWYSLQSPRIQQGLVNIGHEIVDQKLAEYVYCNDPSSYDEAILNRRDGQKLIFNILDVPYHIPNFQEWLANIKPKLQFADIVTCISFTVRLNVIKYLNIHPFVIYNPIKDVTNLGLNRPNNSFCYAGRANDPGKRFNIVREVVGRLSNDNISVCGSENPGYGKYFGILSDSDLN
ncbi:MAG: hypothetical protein EKK57_10860, partial [Proteobacteria bacterium]